MRGGFTKYITKYGIDQLSSQYDVRPTVIPFLQLSNALNIFEGSKKEKDYLAWKEHIHRMLRMIFNGHFFHGNFVCQNIIHIHIFQKKRYWFNFREV